MKVFDKIEDIQSYLATLKGSGKSIGFVPTMGALHNGHIQLVKTSVSQNDITVVSIFVNPIQFNNPEDLAKYPRTIEADIEKLAEAGCDIVFTPSDNEMYPEPDNTEMEFGGLEKVMEGRFRPGHFRGVGIVVKKLFEIVVPDRAYFGEKDYQQLAIIKFMVKKLSIPVEILPCLIVREDDGLAMSSRNTRLTPQHRAAAPEIYKALLRAKENYNWFIPSGLEKLVISEIEQNPELRVEYATVADAVTLQSFEDWMDTEHAILCVAVFAGNVRLIDNILLY
jgi:pantoate--beta-alanine ligase